MKVAPNEQFKKVISDKFGKNVGELYVAWHEGYSQTLAKSWLKMNGLGLNALIKREYIDKLNAYLEEKFKDWLIVMLKEA